MTRGLGRSLRHNTIALLALFLALGGTSFAAASYISGKQIKPHSIPKNRLTRKAIKQLKGNRALTWTTLTLKNNWTGNCYGGGVPQVAKSSEGIVYFRGSMCRTSGTSDNPFALGSGLTPTKNTWVTTDQNHGATGRIYISPTGEVFVEADPNHPTAFAAFTSLAGVEFALQ